MLTHLSIHQHYYLPLYFVSTLSSTDSAVLSPYPPSNQSDNCAASAITFSSTHPPSHPPGLQYQFLSYNLLTYPIIHSTHHPLSCLFIHQLSYTITDSHTPFPSLLCHYPPVDPPTDAPIRPQT